MPAASSSRSDSVAGRVLNFLIAPSRTVEIVAWVLLAGVIIAIRAYLWHLLPAYLWSKDAKGYALPAIDWLNGAPWENDPKRGPVYSVIIAIFLKVFGNFNALIIFQHIVGGLGILLTAFYLRVMLGSRALWPAIACGVALALYGKLLYMEHLIRNDIYLFFLAAVAFLTWGTSLRFQATIWLFVCGLAAASLAITRDMLAPFPLLVLLVLAWQCRKEIKTVIIPAAIFLVGFIIPYAGAKVFRQLTVHAHPSLSQPAQNFFARVAQFTVLDGGIEPEIKALIREDIEKYRSREELDNNEILNQTAVPRIRAYYEGQGKSLGDGDRLFWRLSLEAIRAHPKEYLAQCGSDFRQVHLEMGGIESEPSAGDVRGSIRSLGNQEPWPQLHLEETIKRLEPGLEKPYLRDYRRFNERAWLFMGMPVLFTSVGITLLAIFWRGPLKPWWLTSLAIWWFMMILLCTIGRPLGRYLLPVVPIMFWTLGSCVSLAWIGLTLLLERLLRPR